MIGSLKDDFPESYDSTILADFFSKVFAAARTCTTCSPEDMKQIALRELGD